MYNTCPFPRSLPIWGGDRERRRWAEVWRPVLGSLEGKGEPDSRLSWNCNIDNTTLCMCSHDFHFTYQTYGSGLPVLSESPELLPIPPQHLLRVCEQQYSTYFLSASSTINEDGLEIIVCLEEPEYIIL
jgi:hypothetical protein